MKLKTAYMDFDGASKETGLLCQDPSLAVQASAEEADINTIVRRFNLTGQVPTDIRAPEYGDFTSVTDYQSALNAVIQADESFMAMPAEVRARFHHDPGAFVDFVANPENRQEALKLGLLMPPEAPPEPLAVRVVPEVSPAP